MGIEKMPNRPGSERRGEQETCPNCRGSGKAQGSHCPRCRGTGKLPSAR
jgi:DnaJ-class molecular chaperone